MSVDHLTTAKSPVKKRPVFLDVASGMTVIVRYDYLTGETQDKDWRVVFSEPADMKVGPEIPEGALWKLVPTDPR